jgi:hypothetical protein
MQRQEQRQEREQNQVQPVPNSFPLAEHSPSEHKLQEFHPLENKGKDTWFLTFSLYKFLEDTECNFSYLSMLNTDEQFRCKP